MVTRDSNLFKYSNIVKGIVGTFDSKYRKIVKRTQSFQSTPSLFRPGRPHSQWTLFFIFPSLLFSKSGKFNFTHDSATAAVVTGMAINNRNAVYSSRLLYFVSKSWSKIENFLGKWDKCVSLYISTNLESFPISRHHSNFAEWLQDTEIRNNFIQSKETRFQLINDDVQ